MAGVDLTHQCKWKDSLQVKAGTSIKRMQHLNPQSTLLCYKQNTTRITKEQIIFKKRRKERLIHVKVEIDNGKNQLKNQ